MERRTGHVRRSAGFTLAEVLVTLAVIAVLLALAIPSVAAVRKNLKMTELNATAKELFLAAQNHLTGLAAGGGAGGSGDGTGERLICVESGGAEMEKLLPAGAIDPAVAGGYYMIAYDPDTMAVREVYYAEQALPASGEALRDGYGAEKSDARWAAEIGFYNGSNTAVNPPQTLPRPTVTVENGETLQITLAVDGLPSELWGKVLLTVTVSDGSSQVEVRQKTVDASPFQETVILDGLGENQHFYEVCPGLIPGKDIRITAEVRYEGGENRVWLPASASATTNSLFAGRGGGNAYVACGRHLQNLDVGTSRVDSSVRSAAQTGVIDWSQNGTAEFAPIVNPNLTAYDGRNNELKNLVIGINPHAGTAGVGLFGYFGSTSETPAQAACSNIRLVSPQVTGGGLPTGALVGLVEKARLQVDNCLVYWDGSGNSSDCYVRSSSHTGGLIGSISAEGEVSISYCGVGLPALSATAQSTGGYESVGGLVGNAEKADLTVENTYAVIDQLGGRAYYIAGFIGNAKNVKISNCYAVGNISAQRAVQSSSRCFISGFLNGSGQVSDSYCAMTYFDGQGRTRPLEINYGFMSSTQNNSRAYLIPNAPVTILNENAKDAAACTYETLQDWKAGDPQRWTAQDAVNSHPYRSGLSGQVYPFPGLLAADGLRPIPHYGSWPDEPENVSGGGLAYYERYSDGSWGYYVVDLETREVSDTLKGNSYDIVETGCGVRLPKGTAPETLGEVKVENASFKNAFSFALEHYSDAQYDLYPFNDPVLRQMKSVIYDWKQRGVAIQFAGGNTFTVNPFLAAAIVPGAEYKNLGTETVPLQVRTVEQFAALDDYNPGEGTALFRQTHDIDFQFQDSTSKALLNLRYIYDGTGSRLLHRATPVFGTIQDTLIKNVTVEGAVIKDVSDTGVLLSINSGYLVGCSVVDSTITGNNVAGLVWENTLYIQGCSFRASGDYAKASVTSPSGEAAGLVGENGNEVIGCSVVDSAITGENAAGLVWKNNGTLKECSFRASGNYAKASVTSPSGKAAGLVGDNWNNVTGCFTAATVSGEVASGFAIRGTEIDHSYSNCIVTGGAAAAGFAIEKDVTATNCYALLTVTAERGDAAGFSLITEGPKFYNCYSAAQVSAPQGKAYGFASVSAAGACYYLDRGDVLDGGAGERVDDAGLTKLFAGNSAWTAADANTVQTTHPYAPSLAGQAYPYPRLSKLDHWGDWPGKPTLDWLGLMGVAYTPGEGETVHYTAYGTQRTPEGIFERVDYGRPQFAFDYYTERPIQPFLFYYDPSLTSAEDWLYSTGKGAVLPMPLDGYNDLYQSYKFIYWPEELPLGEIRFYHRNEDGSFPGYDSPSFTIDLSRIVGLG